MTLKFKDCHDSAAIYINQNLNKYMSKRITKEVCIQHYDNGKELSTLRYKSILVMTS